MFDKPRIAMRRGVWVCAVWLAEVSMWYRPIGHGYTPQEAYEDWRQQSA